MDAINKNAWYKRPIVWVPSLIAVIFALYLGFRDNKPKSKDMTKYPKKDSVKIPEFEGNKYIVRFENEGGIEFLLIINTRDPITINSLVDANDVRIFYGKDGGQVINLDDFVNKKADDKGNNIISKDEKKEIPKVDSIFLFTRDTRLNMENKEVLYLQQALNLIGFIVAPSGNGSVGNETEYYGKRTSQALAKFKNAYKERISDFGQFDPSGDVFDISTRKFLNSYLNEQGMAEVIKAGN